MNHRQIGQGLADWQWIAGFSVVFGLVSCFCIGRGLVYWSSTIRSAMDWQTDIDGLVIDCDRIGIRLLMDWHLIDIRLGIDLYKLASGWLWIVSPLSLG